MVVVVVVMIFLTVLGSDCVSCVMIEPGTALANGLWGGTGLLDLLLSSVRNEVLGSLDP